MIENKLNQKDFDTGNKAQTILGEMSGIMQRKSQREQNINTSLEKSMRCELALEKNLGMSLNSLRHQLKFLPENSPEEEFAIQKTIEELIELHCEEPRRNIFIAPNAI